MQSDRRVERFAVARRTTDGLFLQLHESPGATSNHYVESPLDARRVHIRHPNEPFEVAPYYFENSDRMRRWLADCVMVWVTITTEADVDP